MRLNIDDSHYLSPITADDKVAFIEHFKEKEIYDKTTRIPYPFTQKHADEWIEWVEGETQHFDRPVNFAIRRPDGYLIGGIALHGYDLEEPHRAELGFWLAKPYWNKGIMTNAVTVFTEYAFANFKLARLSAHDFDFNASSARVLEKAGFHLEGHLRNYYLKNGKLFDSKLYAKSSDQIF